MCLAVNYRYMGLYVLIVRSRLGNDIRDCLPYRSIIYIELFFLFVPVVLFLFFFYCLIKGLISLVIGIRLKEDPDILPALTLTAVMQALKAYSPAGLF